MQKHLENISNLVINYFKENGLDGLILHGGNKIEVEIRPKEKFVFVPIDSPSIPKTTLRTTPKLK